MVIPRAMAYGAIAGLPLVVGLYSWRIPLVVYTVLGNARGLSVTTTSTIAMPALEFAVLKRLTEAEEKFREAGVVLWLAALNPEPLQMIQKTPLGEALGRERMIYSLKHVVEEYQRRYGAASERKD